MWLPGPQYLDRAAADVQKVQLALARLAALPASPPAHQAVHPCRIGALGWGQRHEGKRAMGAEQEPGPDRLDDAASEYPGKRLGRFNSSQHRETGRHKNPSSTQQQAVTDAADQASDHKHG